MRKLFPFFLITSLLPVACMLDDGPNQTGSEFLDAHDIGFMRELDSVKITGFPVDTFWVESLDSAKVPQLGQGFQWWTGHTHGFSVSSRLGYTIDSGSVPSADYSLFLGLSLKEYAIGQDAQKQALKKFDSVYLVLKSIVFPAGLDDSTEMAEAFFSAWDKTEAFREHYADAEIDFSLDTLGFPIPADSVFTESQYFKTVNLAGPILENRKKNLILFVEVSEVDTSSNTLLRFNNTANLAISENKDGVVTYLPISSRLLFKRKPQPYQSETYFKAQSIRVSHPRLNQSAIPVLLSGKTQGVHLLINPKALIEAVKKEKPDFRIKGMDTQQANHYYLPYSRLSVPVVQDSIFIENGFSLEMTATSAIDSLSEPESTETFSPEKLLVQLNSSHEKDPEILIIDLRDSQILDTLKLHYFSHYEKAPLFHLTLEYSKNTRFNDTLDVSLGASFTHRHFFSVHSQTANLIFTILGDSAKASVTYHLENHLSQEPQFKRDTDNYFNPEHHSISVKATLGMQRLLNNALASNLSFLDFFIRPSHLAGIQFNDGSPLRVSYPVMASIPLKLDNSGRLLVDFTLYLYKL